MNEEMKAKLARKEARVSLTSMSSHEWCSPGMRRGIHRILPIALWAWFSDGRDRTIVEMAVHGIGPSTPETIPTSLITSPDA